MLSLESKSIRITWLITYFMKKKKKTTSHRLLFPLTVEYHSLKYKRVKEFTLLEKMRMP